LYENITKISRLGFAGHHMQQSNPQSYKMYKENLATLAPILKSLTTKTTVFWLHQNPIIETYGNKNRGVAIDRSPTNKKYDDFNVIARKILG
jgi:hypothetical protein